MAKQKPTSRAAARNAAQKKSPARKIHQGRRQVHRRKRKSKARAAGRQTARVRNSVSPSAIIATRISSPTACARYAHYRDLGIADATHGLAQAHVIRLIGPCNPAEVSKLHFHDVEFQLVYVLKGWVKTYLEGQGETSMKEGSCWTQPPRIKHSSWITPIIANCSKSSCPRSSGRSNWRRKYGYL